MRRVDRRQWKAAITTATTLTPTTRVGPLSVADVAMFPGGELVRGVEKLAAGDASRQRRLARYVQAAYEAGWLRQTSKGYRGHAATFIVVPDPDEGQPRRPSGRERVTKKVTQSDLERATTSSTLLTDKKGDTVVTPRKR